MSDDQDDAPPMHGEILAPTTRGDASPIVAAEINQQVATARAYPRRKDAVITDEITGRATIDEEVAAECMYSLPRAGKDITGPSIRFAELVFVSYGNLRAGARFVDLDMKDPRRAAVIIEGVCLDLQSNVAQNIPTRRSIVGRKGIFNADMTNIAFSAGAAIARREAILKTVPKAIWGPAFKRVISVLQGDAKTLGKRRQDVIDAFGRRDIKPERVFAAIGVESIEDIKIEHMPRLFGMLTALADGSETVESLFAVVPGQAAGGERHNPLSDDADEPAAQDGPTQTVAKPQQAETQAPAETTQPKPKEAVQAAEPSAPAAKSEPVATKQAAKPAEATQKAAPQAGGASDEPPTDEKGYIAFASAWLDAAKTESEINDRWASERKLRTACGVTSAGIEKLSQLKAAALAELKAGG